jgi:Tol biopolymer transport system component
MSRQWIVVVTAIAVVALPAASAAQVLERVSVSSDGVEADGRSYSVGVHRAVSADGRFVVFWSEATNLVPDDTNDVEDVFVRDRWEGTTRRVSVDLEGGNADGPSLDASISADGRWVVFTSAATDLVPDDRNWQWDIFVRDLWHGVTSRVSVTPSGGDSNNDSAGASISADGRRVAFVTWARGLAEGDRDWEVRDIIVRDLELGENTLATVNHEGGDPEASCWEASISGDGRRVGFVSSADDLVEGDGNTQVDAFVRDVESATTMRISVDADGADPDGRNRHPRLSDNGRWVTFRSHATNLVADDTNGQADIFVRDLDLGVTRRVNLSTAGDEAQDGGSWFPVISGDGRYVAYLTDATNLYEGDTNGFGDIVATDRVTGETVLLSLSADGGAVNGWSNQPVLSADGRYVVFESIASDMVEGDTNDLWDVFIAKGPASGPHLSIPAVARVQGAGAFFFSRLEVLNSSDEALTADVVFTPRADLAMQPRTTTLELAPRQALSVEDPLAAWFGIGSTGAVGSLMFTVTDGRAEALEAQSVVMARNADGTEYGQFFPGDSNGLHAGETAYLSTTADPWRMRVNVGAMGLLDGTRLELQPVGPIGTPRADAVTIELDAGVSRQLNDVLGPEVFDLEPSTDILLEVRVTAGSALVYASQLDGTGSAAGTNDPTTVLPVRRGADRVTLLELGAAQGVNEFSGSAVITNLSPHDVAVDADFYLRGEPGVAQVTEITMSAGETAGYGDFVGHLFTRSDVGAIVLRARDGGRIAVTGREYSITRNGHGDVVGTAGQLIPGMTDDQRLQPHLRYHLLGLRQRQTAEGLERTHVAAFNPSDHDVEVVLEMFDAATGASEGSFTMTVRAEELVQVNNVLDRIHPGHDGGVKRLEVTVSDPVFVKAFRVNATGDPVTLDAAVE